MTAAQERFNNMNKSMLSAWLKDEKNAADQYREIAEEIYKSRFPDKPSSEADGGTTDFESVSDPVAAFLLGFAN